MTAARARDLLAKSFIFKDAPPEAVSYLAERMHPLPAARGEPIFLIHEPSDQMFFVSTGRVEIMAFQAAQGKMNRVKVIEAGEHFSEFSVLTKSRHSTAAFALEDSELLTLAAEHFLEALHRYKTIASSLAVLLGRMNQKSTIHGYAVEYFTESAMRFDDKIVEILPFDFVKKHGAVPIELRHKTLSVALTNPKNKEFFSAFKEKNPELHLKVSLISEQDYQRLLGSLVNSYSTTVQGTEADWERALKAGAGVRFAGEDGFGASGGTPTSPTPASASPPPGNEIASEVPASAPRGAPSPTPDSPALDPTTIIRKPGGPEGPDALTLLKTSKIFSGLPLKLLEKLATHFYLDHFDGGTEIFSVGSESRALCLLRTGSVELLKSLESGGFSHVATLNPGDSFGEISLLTGTPHSLQAQAVEDTQLFLLSKTVFERLLGEPEFSVALATRLALRMQTMNRTATAKFNPDRLEEIQNHASLFPRDAIESQRIVALAVKGVELQVGAVDPDDEAVYKALNRHVPSYRANLIRLTEEEFALCLQALFGTGSTGSTGGTGGGAGQARGRPAGDPKDFIERALASAREAAATEIQIDPMPTQYLTRFRIDGSMREIVDRIPSELGARVVSRIKSLSQVSGDPKKPAEGVFRTEIAKVPLQIGAQFIPCRGGEKAVLRFQRGAIQLQPFMMLVPDRQILGRLRSALARKYGLLLATSPALGGRTTTLYSMAEHLIQGGRLVVSIEAEPEASLPGMTQLDPHGSPEAALQTALRLRPDCLVFGELRDRAVAQSALDASARGILALATVEASSSLAALTRLRDMGIPTQTLADSLSTVLGQTLVPSLCPRCKQDREPSAAELARLARIPGLPKLPTEIAIAPGCDDCRKSGHRGRAPLFELLRLSPVIRMALAKGMSLAEIEVAARQDGYRPVADFGLRMLLNGLVDFAILDRFAPGWDDVAESARPVVPSRAELPAKTQTAPIRKSA